MTIDLRRGDCLAPDGLASLSGASVGVTITDPPFNAQTHRAALELGARVKGARRQGGELPFKPLDESMISTVASELVRITRRWIVIFCADRQIEAWATAIERAGGRFIRVGAALRETPKPQLSGDRPGVGVDSIVICHSSGERLRWNGGGHSAVWRSPAARFDDGGQVHPTQKPLALMRALISDFTDPGELVLDPFSGAGSTLVACKALGRCGLGWELDPGFLEAARRRIEQAREQLQLATVTPVEQLRLAST